MNNQFRGPIPGENYTSDTRNYAWHRPPEYTDLDQAIEYIGGRLTSEESSVGLLTMMEAGVPLVDLAQMFLMSGVGAGKWTLDFALMLAGPTTHIMSIMGKAYGLKYDLGLDDKSSRPPTMAFMKAVSEINKGKAAAAGRRSYDSLDDIEDETGQLFKDGSISNPPPTFQKGFMGGSTGGSAPEIQQQQMLGMNTPDSDMETM